MRQSELLKESGSFIIAFLLATISFQGILRYMVKDASDFFFNKDFMTLPLIAFLIIYAIFPFLILILWRYVFHHNKVITFLDKESKEGRHSIILEKVSFVIIGIGHLLLIVSVFLIFETDSYLSIIIYIANALLFIGLAIYCLYAYRVTRMNKYEVINKNSKVDISRHLKNVRVEYRIFVIVWFIVSAVMCFGYYSDRKGKEVKEYEIKNFSGSVENILSNLDSLKVREENRIRTVKEINETYYNKLSKCDKAILDKMDSSINEYYHDEIAGSKTFLKSKNYNSLINWVSMLENKHLVIKIRNETQLITILYQLFYELQQFYLVVLIILFFIGLNYWYNIRLIYAYENDESIKKQGSVRREFEFLKSFILLVLVMVFPIMRPLEKEDISFNKPLWTFDLYSEHSSNDHINQILTSKVVNINDSIDSIDLGGLFVRFDSIDSLLKEMVIENQTKTIDSVSVLRDSVGKMDSLLKKIDKEIGFMKTDVGKIMEKSDIIYNEVDKIKRR